jgi:hypothetical protein
MFHTKIIKAGMDHKVAKVFFVSTAAFLTHTHNFPSTRNSSDRSTKRLSLSQTIKVCKEEGLWIPGSQTTATLAGLPALPALAAPSDEDSADGSLKV